jgi:hypothetical protein
MRMKPVRPNLILQIRRIIEILSRGDSTNTISACTPELRQLPLSYTVNTVIRIIAPLIYSVSVNCDALAVVELIVDT